MQIYGEPNLCRCLLFIHSSNHICSFFVLFQTMKREMDVVPLSDEIDHRYIKTDTISELRTTGKWILSYRSTLKQRTI